jgi:transposase
MIKNFKLSAVHMVKEDGKRIAEVARDLDIAEQTLHHWVKKYDEGKGNSFVGSGNLKPEFKAMRDLQKKLRDLEEENAIPKKAMGIFAKNQK